MIHDQDALILGDARRLKRYSRQFEVPPKAIITSPPYLDTQNYGIPNQIGFGQTAHKYLADLQQVFKACWDISHPNAALWLVVGTVRRNGELVQLPGMLTSVARKSGWIPREQVTWAKGKSLPWTKPGEFRDITEQAILFSKTDSYLFRLGDLLSPDPASSWWRRYPERYSPDGRKPTNLWNIPIPTQGAWSKGPGHLCPFPHELAYRLISISSEPGDAILDPFSGIGSVPAMASVMGRIGYGIELSKPYVDGFQETLDRSQEWFAQKSIELTKAQLRHSIFRETILQLRLLKYGKVLAEALTDNGYDIDWVHVTQQHCGPTETNKLVVGHFDVKLKGRRAIHPVLALLYGHSCKRPLSKFGVQPEFSVSSANQQVSAKFWYPNNCFWREPCATQPDGTGPHLSANFCPRLEEILETPTSDPDFAFTDGLEDWEHSTIT